MVDENLFAAPTLEEATENLKQFQTILAKNIQFITKGSRRVDEKTKNAEKEQQITEQRARQNLDHIIAREKIKYALVKLDLRARNEDGMKLFISEENRMIGYFNPSALLSAIKGKNKVLGPASIQFFGPLASKVLASSWILTQAPHLAEKHKHFSKLTTFDAWIPVRRNTKKVTLQQIHYRHNRDGFYFPQLYDLAKQYSLKEDAKRRARLDSIIGCAIFKAQYNAKIVRAKKEKNRAMVKKLRDERKAASEASREGLELWKKMKLEALKT